MFETSDPTFCRLNIRQILRQKVGCAKPADVVAVVIIVVVAIAAIHVLVVVVVIVVVIIVVVVVSVVVVDVVPPSLTSFLLRKIFISCNFFERLPSMRANFKSIRQSEMQQTDFGVTQNVADFFRNKLETFEG